jgi:proteic killer suppression protein
MVIKSFACKYTEKLWEGEVPKKFSSFAYQAKRRLNVLNAASCLKDLALNPGNRLHQLTGSLKNYHSISINMQYRIIFKWENDSAINVEIIDYH